MQQNMNLSMTPYTQAGAFVCSQYDVGRTCQIKLVDESGDYAIPTGATVTVMATKPSGLGFAVECTWSGSTVTFVTTETMTNEFGRFPAEIRVTSGDTVLGTTNFFFKVERSPHPDDVIDGDTIVQQNLVARVTTLETKMETAEDDIADLKSDIGDLSELETDEKSSLVEAINEAAQSGGSGSGLTQTEKNLILTLFSKAAYAEDDADIAYEELESLWQGYSVTWQGSGYSKGNNATSVSSGASFTSTVTANTGYTLDTVTVTMGGTTVQGAWSNGTVTIPSVTGNVVITVTTSQVTVSSISAVYTQSGTVYDTTALDDLKTDLVVTATFVDSSTGVINANDYTLSGTLATGTSTITVAYGGKTTTFNVNVTAAWDYYNYSLTNGQLEKLIGSTGFRTGEQVIEYDPNTTARRSFPTLHECVQSLKDKSTSWGDTIYYPIPIPVDAVSATISITPNTQFHGESLYTYNVDTEKYTRDADPGWKQGTFTHTFAAGQYEYITVASKYNSAGSSYPEEPTEVTLTFATE